MRRTRFGIDASSGYNRGRKLFVLVVRSRDESPACALQRVFACGDLELETAVFGSDAGLHVLAVPDVGDNDASSFQWMSGVGVYDCSSNPEAAVRDQTRVGILSVQPGGRL